MMTLQCMSLCRWSECYLLKSKHLIFLPYARMLCMLLHVYWGVQVYANEIITIHSALSNVPKASFRVLFYNLRAAAMWQKVIEIVKCKRNTSKMKETKKERTNFESVIQSGWQECVKSASLEYYGVVADQGVERHTRTCVLIINSIYECLDTVANFKPFTDNGRQQFSKNNQTVAIKSSAYTIVK